MRDVLLPAAIVVGAAMISGSIIWSADFRVQPAPSFGGATNATMPDPASVPIVPLVDITKVKLAGEPFVGEPTAKAVMAFWYDYQCPFCRQIEQNVLPQLIADYVDTGKLRIYFKDYAFLGPDSQNAALAGRAVWEVAPKAYYAWHSAVFAHQDGENRGWGSPDDLAAVTRSLPAIDSTAVTMALGRNAATYQQAIAADLAEGEAAGIQGTPGAIIGDQLISGAEPYAVFKAAVDRALAASGTP